MPGVASTLPPRAADGAGLETRAASSSRGRSPRSGAAKYRVAGRYPSGCKVGRAVSSPSIAQSAQLAAPLSGVDRGQRRSFSQHTCATCSEDRVTTTRVGRGLRTPGVSAPLPVVSEQDSNLQRVGDSHMLIQLSYRVLAGASDAVAGTQTGKYRPYARCAASRRQTKLVYTYVAARSVRSCLPHTNRAQPRHIRTRSASQRVYERRAFWPQRLLALRVLFRAAALARSHSAAANRPQMRRLPTKRPRGWDPRGLTA